jgi:hypothetical protein
VESKPRFVVIALAAGWPEELTVHSWNAPPVTTGERYAIVLPSGENDGAATR